MEGTGQEGRTREGRGKGAGRERGREGREREKGREGIGGRRMGIAHPLFSA